MTVFVLVSHCCSHYRSWTFFFVIALLAKVVIQWSVLELFSISSGGRRSGGNTKSVFVFLFCC